MTHPAVIRPFTVLMRGAEAFPRIGGDAPEAPAAAPEPKARMDLRQGPIARRDRLTQTGNQRTRLEQRIKEIAQEQARIRENMGRLAQNSELYNRYVKQLDQQETETEKLQKDIETLKGTEDTQKRELNDYLLALDLD